MEASYRHVRVFAAVACPAYDIAMTDTRGHVEQSIDRSAKLIAGLSEHAGTIAQIADEIVVTLEQGGKVLSAGHGGSAADALHIAEELVGRFDKPRPSLPAVSLVADSTLLTCITNDFGYDEVFARQIESMGKAGDSLVLFSTSGRSKSLRRAVEAATENGVTTIALLGKGGGPLAGACDYELIVDSDETARIQEAHGLILHLILEAVDRRFA
jgi:D-sedoheptulose 7-phosphate isomerase